MANSSLSSVVSKICLESALFDSKDRLLNFSLKGTFQTPLVFEAGDLFFEKWKQTDGPLPLNSFLSISDTFTAEQKKETEEQIATVIKSKNEDFDRSDLYLLLGFLKWDGNALAPSILIPVDVNPTSNTLTLAKRAPIENVILRERLKNKMVLPKAEDATINGQFSILLYFSLFEKAISAEKNWKFTRHGICLAFFDSKKLGLKKCLANGFDAKQINSSEILKSVLTEDGFQAKESIFENQEIDKVFDPIDHHFLYVEDSHSTEVMMNAISDDCSAYAIQALPGTDKAKIAANIAAESIANGKKTLVISNRAVTKQNFTNALRPKFRSFDGPEREELTANLKSTRESYIRYYDTVRKKIQPANVPLATLLAEFTSSPAVKIKSSEVIFEGVNQQSFETYNNVKNNLEQIVYLYFEQDGIKARNAFKSIKIPTLSQDVQEELAKELAYAANKTKDLSTLIKLFENSGLFPTGIYLSALIDIIDLIVKKFNQDTPLFEDWELRSSSWADYQDSLKALPEAGDKWVRYRRQTSDIYTDNAIDENILSSRDEFANSLNTSLKGLSDRYRSSRKRLLKVIKNPKSISSDEELLDLADTLIDLQENRRSYKDTSVLGSHLLGKDWLYEKSNWFELNKKISYLYDFREANEKSPQFDLLLQILEKWNLFKDEWNQMDGYAKSIKELQAAIRHITKALSLETPLESLSIEKWLNEILSWNENWANLDIHIQLTSLFKDIEELGCKNLATYLEDTNNVNKNIVQAYTHYWSGCQIQQVGKECPELFSLLPKARSQKSKEFRTSLDKFYNANFRIAHALIDSKPELFKSLSLAESFDIPNNEIFDLTLIQDAETISLVETLPLILKSKKIILIGDPNKPSIEYQTIDGFQEDVTPHTAIFQENILTACLHKGIPSKELWLSNVYPNFDMVAFANNRIYNNSVKQFPIPNRDICKTQSVRLVSDKIMAIAKAAVIHAEKKPSQTLGIIAFHQDVCNEIESAIKAIVNKDSNALRFLTQNNPETFFFIKTPERAADRFRDTIFVYADPDGCEKTAYAHKLSVCTTLAKQELQVFISESDMAKKPAKSVLFWDWISYLQKQLTLDIPEPKAKESILTPLVKDVLMQENIQIEPFFAKGGIPVGPVIIDANNPKRFLAMVEDDCTTDSFCESIEDRIYIRHTQLRQLGWKVLNIWLPFWYMANNDEISHMITTIAIEQSVAPPPSDEISSDQNFNTSASAELNVAPYMVMHPKIEGTPHDKPIEELPASSIVTQLKFYIDHEAPLHEDLLPLRLLELHKETSANEAVMQAINSAIKQGFKSQRFIQTGKFFYSIKNPPVVLRDRTFRPDSERKMTYVSPEERMLLPPSMDEHAIKQALGLLE